MKNCKPNFLFLLVLFCVCLREQKGMRSKRTKRAFPIGMRDRLKISLPVWAHFQIFILHVSILLKQKGQDDPAGRMKI